MNLLAPAARNFWVAVILLALGVLTYGNSLNNAFLMDDYPMLIENHELGGSAFLQLDPSAADQVYFRPVTHLLNFVTFSFFGKNPVGYHLTNLFFFYLAGLAIYAVLNKILVSPLLSFLTAALFIIHPINGVCVNYKNATADAFLVLAIHLSLLNILQSAENKDRLKQLLSLIWLALAIFCHELALAFPLYLVSVLFFSRRYFIRDILKIAAPSTCLLIVYFIFRLHFATLKVAVLEHSGFPNASLGIYLATYAKLIFWYLAKVFSLQGIVLMWNTAPVYNFVVLWCGILIAASLLICLGIVLNKEKRPAIALGLCWFLISCLPVIFACCSRPWFGFIIEPFWLILGSIGIFLVAADVLLRLRPILQKIWPLVPMLLGVNLIVQSWGYNFLWADPIRYGQYWKNISPGNFFPRFWLAYTYLERKDYAEAKEMFQDLLDHGLKFEWVYGNLGILEYRLGNYPKAIDYLNQALHLVPSRGDTYYYLGLARMQLNQFQAAEEAFRESIRLAPEIKDAQQKLAEVYEKEGKHSKNLPSQ